MVQIPGIDNPQFGGEKDALCDVLKNLGANAYEVAKFEQDEINSVKLSPSPLAIFKDQGKKITV